MTENISINGLKLSEPLIAVWVDDAGRTVECLSLFCRILAKNEINLAFLTSTIAGDPQPALCCINPKDQAVAAERIDRTEALRECVRFGDTVGVITFYPHHFSLKMMGMALQVFSQNGIEVHGLASSIAALSFVVDFDHLEKAGRLITETFELPSNVSPPKADFIVRQERRPL